jgi:hypothetical protein
MKLEDIEKELEEWVKAFHEECYLKMLGKPVPPKVAMNVYQASMTLHEKYCLLKEEEMGLDNEDGIW